MLAVWVYLICMPRHVMTIEPKADSKHLILDSLFIASLFVDSLV